MSTLHDHMSEDDLKTQIVAYAQARGWLVHHDRPARRRDGTWATHIEGDPGFPDLVLARNGTVHIAELKRQDTAANPTPDQERWLNHLGKGEYGANVHVWRPADLPDIRQLLE